MFFASRTQIVALLATIALFAGAGVHAVEKVSVKGLFKDKAILAIDGKQRLLRTGETSPEGVKLIRADSREAVIEIDGVQTTRGLGTHIGSDYAEPESRAVQIYPTNGNVYTVVGSINGYPVNFVVDTGATAVSMNSIQARRLGIDYAVEGRPGLSQTASGIVKTYIVQLKRVKVGDIELTNVEGSVHEGDFPTEVLLGMSFLGRLDIQREDGVLELRKKY
ncbi:MAG: retroviral-like aspartic protease family protein [Gammaproteobacteria bacterium]|nr:retroviral-like aspartic protease family protein [Gammaproteobacteria bacterium]MDH3412278.1 retroviral-like aspartic protease family protein [Gammaproteobacteria bacterium]